MLPVDLVLVRHGQSEENLADKMARRGDNSYLNSEFVKRHGRQFRLTDNGIVQSKAAGEWIRKNISTFFSHLYVSDFIRAKETAVHLDLPQARWKVKYEIRERDQSFMNNSPNLGHKYLLGLEQYRYAHDPFYSYPAGGGESIATLCLRLKTYFLDDLEKECRQGEKAIVVCHGHVMRALQLVIEDLGHDDFIRLDVSREPAERILNCQIFWYSRRDPETLRVDSTEFVAVRSVCASGLIGDYGWRRIVRNNLSSNEELLAEVKRCPRYLND